VRPYTTCRTMSSQTMRYDDICTEWLGGLTILKHKSKIGEQLGQHIGQLVATGFLASYTVKKAENRDGFVIVFWPGVVFFEDYERFYRRRQQGELQWVFHDDRQQVSEPLKVAYLFAGKRTGHPADSIAFVRSKDVETAKLVLAALGFDEFRRFWTTRWPRPKRPISTSRRSAAQNNISRAFWP